jgi:hypothetical protein
MNIKTILPPQGEEKLLQERNLQIWADYRIANHIESELEKVFETKRIEGGGLIITAYKQDETKIK